MDGCADPAFRSFPAFWWPPEPGRRRGRIGLGLACSLAMHVLGALLIVFFAFPRPVPPESGEAVPVELVRVGEETIRPAQQEAGERQPEKQPEAPKPAPPAVMRVAQSPPPTPKPVTGPKPNPLADFAPQSKPRPLKDTDAQIASIENPPQTAIAPETEPGTGAVASDATANRDNTSLGQPASYSVKDFIRAQIERHWNFDVRALGAADLAVKIHIALEPNGTVTSADIVDDPRYAANPAYRELAISARDAALVSSPLQLPPGSYYAFKDITLSFDPKEALR